MSVRIIQGDCRDVLKTLADASVHCCVTSPPYYGLRDYGNDLQVGLEATPAEYVAEMVAVFREVRRVLRDDGVLWLNLGDSYASDNRKSRDPGKSIRHPAFDGEAYADGLRAARPPGIKPKDLLGIPWRVAFALQADGWYLRQDIIWSKPNPMPESVRDRCTKAHEYVFLLSKSERYWWDVEAMQEPAVGANEHDLTGRTKQRLAGNVNPPKGQLAYESGDDSHRTKGGLLAYAERQRSKGNRKTFRGGGAYTQGQSFNNHHLVENDSVGNEPNTSGTRNRRSVWTISTRPFSEAHFATMPPELAEVCVRAGCPEGGMVLDPFCGAGTTALVADQLQRSAIGIELSAEYIEIARRRISGDAPLFADVEVTA